jgi:hypothetical protein
MLDALASITMMMEDTKIYNNDIYVMYTDFKGAFNAADHRIMFEHMRQLDMPPSFVDTCEQPYGVSTTDNNTPCGPTPSIDINRGTLHGDTLSLFSSPSSLNPSYAGIRSATGATVRAPPRPTPTPTNLRYPTQATASPMTSA